MKAIDPVKFAEQGFGLVPHVLSTDACERVDVMLRKVSATNSRRLLAHAWCRDLAAHLAEHPQLQPFLPADSRAVQCTFFDKSADHNWLVAFHQDVAVPIWAFTDGKAWMNRTQKEGEAFASAPTTVLASLLAVRVHLDRCGEHNGPLRCIPGSHKQGRLNAETLGEWRSREAKTLTAERGDTILLKPLVLHASSKSETDAPRRVLHFLFAPGALCKAAT